MTLRDYPEVELGTPPNPIPPMCVLPPPGEEESGGTPQPPTPPPGPPKPRVH